MQDLNKLFLIGRLTKDIGSDPNGRDFGYTQSGTCKAVVSIASNLSKKDQNGQWTDDVNYFDITIWGKTAENLKPYLLKGTMIAVEAHLKQDKWTDQQGQNHSKISIIADSVQLCGGKKDNANFANPNTVYPNVQAQRQAYAQNGFNQNPSMNPAQNMPQQNFQPPVNQSPAQQNGFAEDIPWDNNSPIPF